VTRGQPVLVGTASIETSELIDKLLNETGIPHEVLNAKQHEREAGIVAQAGRPGAVTIATNMAGRGTDIVLGGNLEAELDQAGPEADPDAIRAAWKERHAQVIAAGGLHVTGTERHESRRIDNQLRGRSGRQGDPGSSRFYLSLEDNLMRIFASERVSTLMQKLGMQPGEAIEHPWVTKAIENAQRKVEGRNFDIRKQLLEYDDVANDQRKVIYRQRRELMDTDSVLDTVTAMRDDVLAGMIDGYMPRESLEEQWRIADLSHALAETFGGDWPIQHWLDEDHDLDQEQLRRRIHDGIAKQYADKEAAVGSEAMRQIEKAVMLQTLDTQWKDHLAAMDYLRQGIHLRGYAQKNPKQEYKREAFEMFSAMLDSIKAEVVTTLAKLRIQTADEIAAINAARADEHEFQFQHEEFHGLDTAPEPEGELLLPRAEPGDVHHEPFVREQRKVGRNEPCPCGSGKKYKHCHGKVG
jgi:preprotein translocase subunit SecA